MKRSLLLLVSVIFILSACTLKGPEVEVRPPVVILDPPVKVETDDHDHSHRHRKYPKRPKHPKHCPPGHAKKGWC